MSDSTQNPLSLRRGDFERIFSYKIKVSWGEAGEVDEVLGTIFDKTFLMTIHKEGYKSIAIGFILFGIINILSFYFISPSAPIISWIIFIVTLGLLIFLISFFRIPNRSYTPREDAILAPADGVVVTIEQVKADEYFTDQRIQVSIFMSPLNVHVNRNPVNGEVA